MLYFGADIVGRILAVHYPEPIPSVFHVKVISFASRNGWHSVRSVTQRSADKTRQTWDFLNGRWEEEFVDLLNVNLYFEQGLVYFVGEEELNQRVCGLCRLPAVPIALCDVQCSRCHQLFHRRCVEEKKKPLSVSGLCVHCRSDYASHVTVVANFADARVKTAIDIVSREMHALQCKTRVTVRLIEGSEYLRSVCNGNSSVALQALQSCSVAGVLQWYYDSSGHMAGGSGSAQPVEAENTRILKRGLDPQDTNTILLVAVPEVCISSRGKTTGGIPKHSLSFAVHNTLGFVVVAAQAPGLTNLPGLAQILLFAARSTHARHLDELVSIVKEGGNSVVSFSLWDTLTKLPVCISDLQTETETMLTRPLHSSTSSVTRSHIQSVRIDDSVLTREQANTFPTRRFLLTSKLQTVPFMCPVYVEAPSRLLLGAAMRLMQELGRSAVLLELALPVNGPVSAPGQGREVHMCLTDKTLIPSVTANVAAYKIYRAFGFGESAALLPYQLNAQTEYLYPVMISACSLITKDQLRRVIVRKISSLFGISGWLNDAGRAKQPARTTGLLAEVLQAETAKLPIQRASATPAPKVCQPHTFVQELALFEFVVDHISSVHPTCPVPAGLERLLLPPAPKTKGVRLRLRLRSWSDESFKSLESETQSFSSVASPTPPRRKLPRRSVAGRSLPWTTSGSR